MSVKKKAKRAIKDLGRFDENIVELEGDEKLSKRDKKKVKKKPSYSYLVTMFYSNGKKKTFVVASKKETFKHGGRTYYLRYEDAYYDVDSGLHELCYHDDFAVPISREIHVEKDDPYFTVKSGNIKELLDMEYVKVLAQAQELSKYLQFMLVLIVVMLFILVYLTYTMYRFGQTIGASIV